LVITLKASGKAGESNRENIGSISVWRNQRASSYRMWQISKKKSGISIVIKAASAAAYVRQHRNHQALEKRHQEMAAKIIEGIAHQ